MWPGPMGTWPGRVYVTDTWVHVTDTSGLLRVRVRFVFEPLMTTGIEPGANVSVPDLGSLDQSRLWDKKVCTGEHRSAAPVLFLVGPKHMLHRVRVRVRF